MRAPFVAVAIMLGLCLASTRALGQEAGSVGACADVGEVPLDELRHCQAGQQAARLDDLLPDDAGGLTALERRSLVAACADAGERGPTALRRCQALRLAEMRPAPGVAPAEAPVESAVTNDVALAREPQRPAPEPRVESQLTSIEVAELQALLAEAGYDPGLIDGLLGPATARAIERYERRAARPATGRATPELLAELRDGGVRRQVAEPALPQPEGDPSASVAADKIVGEELVAPPGPVAAQRGVLEPAPARPEQPEPSPAPAEPSLLPQEPDEAAPVRLDASEPGSAAAVDGLSSAEVYARSKDAVWQVVAGMDFTAFESWSGLSQGSAVAVGQDRLLTDCGIIAGFSLIYVLQDESVDTARIVSSEQDADRCVLAPTQKLLPSAVDIRRYRDLRIGERVFTIDNPSGLERIIGEGEIASLRTIEGVPCIETTAPIAPDSTGVGLFDDRGRLIGITIRSIDSAQQLNLAVAADSFGSD